MSREWMFSGTLTVKTDEEWMRTRTRKGTLTLEDSEFIETMGDAFKETYSPRVPAELTYIVVIDDSSKLELDDSHESCSGLIDSGYLAAKPASRESWQAWINQPGFTWTKVMGGMLSYPPFREDQMRVKDKDYSWLVPTGR